MGCDGSKNVQDTKAAPKAAAGRTVVGSQLTSPEDLKSWPQFPDDCQQLTKVALTKEVWDEYGEKSDAKGVSFKQMIFSGCKFPESKIGCYAGSMDSYSTFNKFFDKIIEDYHGLKPTDNHVSDMDASGLNCPPLPEDEAAMIMSTRIRVGRNLAEYPLGPGITKEDRLKVMDAVTSACEGFEDDLKGTVYKLEGMDEPTRKQLIEDHVLFVQGDEHLESAGLNRDWPSGRGIFMNNEKSFNIWINEEDQLRIISMQKGADIHAVFERLCRAAKLIEQKAKFSHNDHLGYITSCPTNLGTALRASVHIKLPHLAKDMEKFQAIAKQYNVQIRGSGGETSDMSDGIFDISNRRRLGRSEKDLVQDMYNGVKAMITEEKALAAAQ